MAALGDGSGYGAFIRRLATLDGGVAGHGSYAVAISPVVSVLERVMRFGFGGSLSGHFVLMGSVGTTAGFGMAMAFVRYAAACMVDVAISFIGSFGPGYAVATKRGFATEKAVQTTGYVCPGGFVFSRFVSHSLARKHV